MRKNQNAFIRSLDPLAEKQKFEVLFLGQISPGCAYGEEFSGLIRARPWCRHLGFAGREELRKHMSGDDYVGVAFFGRQFGPMAVLESMAAGLPVMAAGVGGVPDLIENERTGIFCDPLDAKSMSEAVERILIDPAAAWEMAKRAKQEARERFHPKIIAQKHIEIYQEVLRTPS